MHECFYERQTPSVTCLLTRPIIGHAPSKTKHYFLCIRIIIIFYIIGLHNNVLLSIDTVYWSQHSCINLTSLLLCQISFKLLKSCIKTSNSRSSRQLQPLLYISHDHPSLFHPSPVFLSSVVFIQDYIKCGFQVGTIEKLSPVT